MEATTLDTEEIYNKIKAVEGIADIHEFHIWHTDTNENQCCDAYFTKRITKQVMIIKL